MAQSPKPKRERLSIRPKGQAARQQPAPLEALEEPPASEEEASSIREAIKNVSDAFFAIGSEAMPTTVLPRAKNRNNAEEAAEFVLSKRLAELANDRLKKAEEAAERAGIFGKPEDYEEGSTVQTWQSPHYSVGVKLGKESKMINKDLVEATFLENFGSEKTGNLLEACMKPRAAPKQKIVLMK